MVGEKMKELRILRGISAEQVAAFLHVSPATIYRYESGDISKMPAKFLKPLAEYLLTTPAELMGWTVDPVPDSPQPEVLAMDEQLLIDTYRSLSDHGREYIQEQMTIASHMYGEKSDSDQQII